MEDKQFSTKVLKLLVYYRNSKASGRSNYGSTGYHHYAMYLNRAGGVGFVPFGIFAMSGAGRKPSIFGHSSRVCTAREEN